MSGLRLLLLLLPAALAACSSVPDVTTQPIPTSQYEVRILEGWTVYVNRRLLREDSEVGPEALKVLAAKLHEIARAVPGKPCAELRKVPFWLGVDDGPNDRAQYHPSPDWLRKHGFNPEKAKGVEIGNAARFLRTAIDQPSMVLHELAHAYHDRVLGFGDERIRAAYDAAVKGGKYDSVLFWDGRKVSHYGLTSPQEYFAEGTEAYFGTNDFYPFVRVELREHDPALAEVLDAVWK